MIENLGRWTEEDRIKDQVFYTTVSLKDMENLNNAIKENSLDVSTFEGKIKENITEYFYEDETGDARITVYHLFPGLNVSYVSTHTSRIDFSSLKKEKQKKRLKY